MRIAVTGYYGFYNFGDELFIIACKLGADKYWKAHELLFVSPPVDGIEADFIVPGWFPRRLYAQMGLSGKIIRMLFLLAAIIRSNAVLNAGGSTISSDSSDSKLKLQLLMKRWFGKKLFGIGLSIGPFSSVHDRESAKALLQQFDGLVVRDTRSCRSASELLPGKHVGCSVDLVGIVAEQYHFDEISKSVDVIGVSMMRFDDTYRDVHGDVIDVERSMMTILKVAQKHRMKVRLFVLNMHPVDGDIEVSEAFIALLEAHEVEHEKITLEVGPLQVWERISECSMMVSYRLHGALAAYLADIPFYLMEYHQKCTDLLDDIGYPDAFRHQAGRDEDVLSSFMRRPARPSKSYRSYMKKACDGTRSFDLDGSVSVERLKSQRGDV